MSWLEIGPTDISTVSIYQEISTWDGSLNLTSANTVLQANIQVDVQPVSGRFAEDASGGAWRMTHQMFCDIYTNVQTYHNNGAGPMTVIETIAGVEKTYEVHRISNWETHMEIALEERL